MRFHRDDDESRAKVFRSIEEEIEDHEREVVAEIVHMEQGS